MRHESPDGEPVLLPPFYQRGHFYGGKIGDISIVV
jgi:hypothetical protein